MSLQCYVTIGALIYKITYTASEIHVLGAFCTSNTRTYLQISRVWSLAEFAQWWATQKGLGIFLEIEFSVYTP